MYRQDNVQRVITAKNCLHNHFRFAISIVCICVYVAVCAMPLSAAQPSKRTTASCLAAATKNVGPENFYQEINKRKKRKAHQKRFWQWFKIE